MKIVALEAENVKHLKVVNIKPDGSLVVIGGDNAQGKTCVLDSIEYALGGAGAIPSQPIRKGEKKARVVLDLGEIQVTRTFTPGGTKVVVKSKEGATFASPQAMLDKLVGELTFDPLEFSKMDAKKQAAVLKTLVGLDCDEIDARYKELFDRRTVVNREGKATKATLEGVEKHDGVPSEPISVQELSDQYAEAVSRGTQIESVRRGLIEDKKELDRLRESMERLQEKIVRDTERFDELCKDQPNADRIREQMRTAETTNAKIEENLAYDKTEAKLEELRKESGSLTQQMAALKETKAKMIAEAEFPVDGMAIEDGVVTFEGIPFDQCSTAQRIRVSVAMGLAMNPELRVLLIREGSLLDEQNLAMIAEMADDFDAQVWMERVSKGDECQVIIEDGSVKE